ncbi:MAG: homoserine O-succinyltransferase [Polyangiales bacterium]
MPRDPRRPRVGVINLMPRAETYEPLLHAAMPDAALAYIRLARHGYRSSDAAHLARHYRPWAQTADLDAVLLTGAPVEHLDFDAVTYWEELRALLDDARARRLPVLGVCWGAMALARTLGVEKISLLRKVFGAFDDALTPAGQRALPTLRGRLRCAQSRHAGLRDDDVRRAEREGAVVVLARGEETGASLLRSEDGRVWMHLGHPEYVPARITFEWQRDRAAGRTDVPAPRGFDPDGVAPVTPWEPDARAFFRAWFDSFAGRRDAVEAA